MFDRAKQLLSATEFRRSEVTDYARDLILPETRVGLLWLAVLLLGLQFGIWILEYRAGRGEAYFYTFCMLSLLSVHMLWSVKFVKDTTALHYLAMAYLLVYAMATVLVAHRAGTFDIALMASAVMLIVVVPLIPWGLQEAAAVTILIYTLFTASTIAVKGRFDVETLFTLQFLLFASAIIVVVLVARNVRVRKHDIETRYDLEQAQRRHEHLSLTDPLTGAFNRRFLDQNYQRLVEGACAREQRLVLALLDVDRFKPLNDTFGHHCGDSVLKQLVRILNENLPGDSLVIRLGGDEFAVLFTGQKCEQTIDRCLRHLETDPAVLRLTEGHPVTVSAGFAVAAEDGSGDTLDDAYRRADDELYARKRGHRPDRTQPSLPERPQET
ncbi:MAG: GGDEF domain-containing protein [Gammaproteobacteria bacterium]|nr:GGDEF domain-containing protein [Gammaproteobacteria bacterium]